MKQTRDIMGMPITVEISGAQVLPQVFEKVFNYFNFIDETFSTYKTTSEISKINRKELALEDSSSEMQEVFRLSEETKKNTQGYFNIQTPQGLFDPSGLVKGWAIYKASLLIEQEGYENFFVEAGGDVQASVEKTSNKPWTLGIRNPFNREEVIKVLSINNEGVATSGTYIRGQHVYNPHRPEEHLGEIVSITVVGSNIYEADRFATAAFAMGKEGITFIESLPGFEGYQISKDGVATLTSGFSKFVIKK